MSTAFFSPIYAATHTPIYKVHVPMIIPTGEDKQSERISPRSVILYLNLGAAPAHQGWLYVCLCSRFNENIIWMSSNVLNTRIWYETFFYRTPKTKTSSWPSLDPQFLCITKLHIYRCMLALSGQQCSGYAREWLSDQSLSQTAGFTLPPASVEAAELEGHFMTC